MPTESEAFLERPGGSGVRSEAQTYLKKALCHTCLIGGTVDKYNSTSYWTVCHPCWMVNKLDEPLLVKVNLDRHPPASGGRPHQGLTLLVGVEFIAKRPFLGECRRGLRHFWSRWATARRPELPKKGLVPYSSVWWDVRQISLD